MIVMSRLRHFSGPLALLLTLAGGCQVTHVCSTVACLDGLNVTLDSSFQVGQTFQVEFAELTASDEVVPFMTCLYSPTQGQAASQLTCQSAHQHAELGALVRVLDYQPRKVSIKVLSNGSVLTEKTFIPIFTSREINGEGCGTCTQAAIIMGLTASP